MTDARMINVADLLESEPFSFSDSAFDDGRGLNQATHGSLSHPNCLSSAASNASCSTLITSSGGAVHLPPPAMFCSPESKTAGFSAGGQQQQEHVEYLTELTELLQDALNRPDSLLQGSETPALMDLIKQLRQHSKQKTENAVQHEDISSSGPILLASHIGPIILEYLDGFFFVMNTDGLIEYVSQNVVKYLRYNQSEMANKPIYNFIHRSDHDLFSGLLPDTLGWNLLAMDNDCASNEFSGKERKSHRFMCRFLTNPSAECSSSETIQNMLNLQVTAISLPSPSNNSSDSQAHLADDLDDFNLSFNVMLDSQPCLVCVARRLPEKSGQSSFEGCQMSVTCNKNGLIMAVNPKDKLSSQLIPKDLICNEGSLIQHLCHPQDTELLNCLFNDNRNTKLPLSLRLLCSSLNTYVPVQVKFSKFGNISTSISNPVLTSFTTHCHQSTDCDEFADTTVDVPYLHFDFTIMRPDQRPPSAAPMCPKADPSPPAAVFTYSNSAETPQHYGAASRRFSQSSSTSQFAVPSTDGASSLCGVATFSPSSAPMASSSGFSPFFDEVFSPPTTTPTFDDYQQQRVGAAFSSSYKTEEPQATVTVTVDDVTAGKANGGAPRQRGNKRRQQAALTPSASGATISMPPTPRNIAVPMRRCASSMSDSAAAMLAPPPDDLQRICQMFAISPPTDGNDHNHNIGGLAMTSAANAAPLDDAETTAAAAYSTATPNSDDERSHAMLKELLKQEEERQRSLAAARFAQESSMAFPPQQRQSADYPTFQLSEPARKLSSSSTTSRRKNKAATTTPKPRRVGKNATKKGGGGAQILEHLLKPEPANPVVLYSSDCGFWGDVAAAPPSNQLSVVQSPPMYNILERLLQEEDVASRGRQHHASPTASSPLNKRKSTATIVAAATSQPQMAPPPLTPPAFFNGLTPQPAKTILVQLLERPVASHISQTKSLPTSIANTQFDKIAKENKENPGNQPVISTLIVESLLNNSKTNKPQQSQAQMINMPQMSSQAVGQQPQSVLPHNLRNCHLGQQLSPPLISPRSTNTNRSPSTFALPTLAQSMGTNGGQHQQHQQTLVNQSNFESTNGQSVAGLSIGQQMHYAELAHVGDNNGGAMMMAPPPRFQQAPPARFAAPQSCRDSSEFVNISPPGISVSGNHTGPPGGPGLVNVRQQLILQQQKKGRGKSGGSNRKANHNNSNSNQQQTTPTTGATNRFAPAGPSFNAMNYFGSRPQLQNYAANEQGTGGPDRMGPTVQFDPASGRFSGARTPMTGQLVQQQAPVFNDRPITGAYRVPHLSTFSRPPNNGFTIQQNAKNPQQETFVRFVPNDQQVSISNFQAPQPISFVPRNRVWSTNAEGYYAQDFLAESINVHHNNHPRLHSVPTFPAISLMPVSSAGRNPGGATSDNSRSINSSNNNHFQKGVELTQLTMGNQFFQPQPNTQNSQQINEWWNADVGLEGGPEMDDEVTQNLLKMLNES